MNNTKGVGEITEGRDDRQRPILQLALPFFPHCKREAGSSNLSLADALVVNGAGRLASVARRAAPFTSPARVTLTSTFLRIRMSFATPTYFRFFAALRFVFFAPVFFAADFVFDFAFFAMLPS